MMQMTLAVPALLILALLASPAGACGWWGDSVGDTDPNDAIVVGADGAPIMPADPAKPEEQARLADRYRRGDGVPQDSVLARHWARLAAEAGHPGAMNDLGQMLEAGSGGPKDEIAALRWYRASAERGVAEARHNLATMLRRGRGVPQDLGAAERWMRLSARQGHASAEADLAEMIWADEVKERELQEGCFWWLVALRMGHRGTIARCRQPRSTLSQDDLDALLARAEKWTPSAGPDTAALNGDRQ